MCRESVGQHFIIFLGNFYETSGSSFQPRISYKAFLVNLFFRSLKIKFQQQLSNYQKTKEKETKEVSCWICDQMQSMSVWGGLLLGWLGALCFCFAFYKHKPVSLEWYPCELKTGISSSLLQVILVTHGCRRNHLMPVYCISK